MGLVPSPLSQRPKRAMALVDSTRRGIARVPADREQQSDWEFGSHRYSLRTRHGESPV
jgi:hypothetical protein